MHFAAAVTLLLLVNVVGFGQSSRSSSSDAPIGCVADIRWLNSNGTMNHSRGAQVPQSLTLLGHLSKAGECGNAEITFSATFLTESQDFICSGTIRQAMAMSSEVQVFNVEVRPFSQLDFLRWRNQPGVRGTQQGKRLTCLNLDGTSDLGDTDRQKAAWIRLSVGLIPSGGGLSVVEALVRVNP